MSARLPRATCPTCGGDVAVRRGGRLREHSDHRHPMYGVPGALRDGLLPQCAASGLTLELAERRIAEVSA